MTTRLKIVLPKIYDDPFVAGVVCAKLGIEARPAIIKTVIASAEGALRDLGDAK
jgi:hypothetical protein